MPRQKFNYPSIPEDLVHEYLDERLSEDPDILTAGMTRIIKMARIHFKKDKIRTGYSQDSLRAACLNWINEHGCIVSGTLAGLSMAGVPLSEEHKKHISDGWRRRTLNQPLSNSKNHP
jgi:hypothetical protein